MDLNDTLPVAPKIAMNNDEEYDAICLEWLENTYFVILIPDQSTRNRVMKGLRDDPLLVPSLVRFSKDRVKVANYIQKNLGIDINSPIPDESTTLSSMDREVLFSAFNGQYDDTSGSRLFAFRTLTEYVRNWSPESMYFPGTAAVQTSGSGKSRMFTAMSELGVYVFYCSFMPEESSGFPGRTSIASDLLFLEQSISVEIRFIAYFVACMETVNEAIELKKSAKDFWKQQFPDFNGSFWSAIRKRMRRLLEEIRSSKISPVNIKSFIRNHVQVLKDVSFRTLFIFDEVRNLMPAEGHENSVRLPRLQSSDEESEQGNPKLNGPSLKHNNFVCMRRAARWLPQKCGAFIIMLDTTSRVNEISPPKALDPSERAVGSGFGMYPPLYLIVSIDIKVPFLIGKTMESVFDPSIHYLFGRPLWSTLVGEDEPDSIRRLAMAKLVGGSMRYHEISVALRSENHFELSLLEALSVLRARLPFSVCRSDKASELIAGYLSWCSYISEDRYMVVSTMPSEGVVAEAAAVWMAFPAFRAKLLSLFVSAISTGTIDPGTGGEVAAQLLLLMARDRVALVNETAELDKFNVPHMCKPIQLKHLIFSLMQAEYAEQLCLQSARMAAGTNLTDIMAVGMISFTHFVYVNQIPTPDELLLLFARGAAVCCRVGQAGIDLLFGVLLPNAEGNYILHVDHLTYCVIQVKSFSGRGKDPSYAISSTAKNSAVYSGLEAVPRHMYLSLYMGFGGKEGWHEFPEATFVSADRDVPESVSSFLICGHDYDARLMHLRENIASLTPANLEVIRRHRQLTIALLGFDPIMYPCVLTKAYDTHITDSVTLPPPPPPSSSSSSSSSMITRSTKGKNVIVRLPYIKRRQLARWDNPKASKVTANLLKELSEIDKSILFDFERLLRSSHDPVSYHLDPKAKDLVKRMSTPMYIEILTEKPLKVPQQLPLPAVKTHEKVFTPHDLGSAFFMEKEVEEPSGMNESNK